MPPSALVVDSPIGPLRLESADGVALSAIRFEGEPAWPDAQADSPAASAAPSGTLDDVAVEPPAQVLVRAAEQLAAYFAGRLRDFDLPLAPRGTDFQRRVWSELATVPYGTTISYGELAARAGRPVSASRAVGAANGANPIPVVVPCHRVIGADGTLTGYAGGLARKDALLRLEGVPTERDQLELF